MRLCASLFRGVAAPLGCVICLQLGDVAVFSLCAQYFLNVQGGRALSLPSEHFTRFGNPAWPGVRTAYFAAFGAWSGVLPKNAESLRDSDALMRVAVPKASRPRWAAWSFFVSDEITACTPYSRNFFQFSRRSSLCCSCASCFSTRSFSARSCSRVFSFVIVLDPFS